MKRLLVILYVVIYACSTSGPKGVESPLVSVKRLEIEDIKTFGIPGEFNEFVNSNPEYKGAVMLANERLGAPEIRKRFEAYGYAPYIVADLDGDGKDEYAFVILNQGIPEIIIIKRNIQNEWNREFSLKLDSFAQIKLSEPSTGLFANPCVIVTNISLRAVKNICWDGKKYMVIEF